MRDSKKYWQVLKISLAVLFVIAVAFFVVRGCVRHHRIPVREVSKPGKISPGLARPPLIIPPTPIPPIKEARMAIILDDWGNNQKLLQVLFEIDRPITVSVLPHLKYSQPIAEEAFNHKLGVMLHMPMQPKNKKMPLEPKTILTTMPDAQIQQYLASALASVPHAEGVNNHMGSAATADLHVMRAVLSYLKQQGLFFVDSNTSTATVGPRVARETGVLFGKRDVFIDNEPSAVAIKRQLEKAKKIALLSGRVVVIGHDKALTLKTIQETVPELEKEGIRFVLVRDLVEIDHSGH